MSLKKVSSIGCALLNLLFVSPVLADTITYQGIVTSTSGVHSAVIPLGTPVQVAYTLDPTAT